MGHRPNVLFVLADQHNAKVLGHQGHPDVRTPHLDRLASEGVRFENAITQNPICTPSRISWLSGQYPHNHGYYGLRGPNPNGLPTVLGHFRRAGYLTAAIGKIHCPEYWVEDDCDLFHETSTYSVGGRSRAYEQYLAEQGVTHLEDHEALQEFGRLGYGAVDGRPSKVSYQDSQEGWSVRQGIAFMETCQRERRPFFLHLGLPKPHQSYAPAQEFWDLYDPTRLTLPPNAEYPMAGKSPRLRRRAAYWRSADWLLFEPKTFAAGRLRKLRGYLGNVSQVDFAFGELLEWLAEQGLEEETIVVYSSDHGDYACEHGNMEKAPGICADAITRVPFIWRWTGKFAPGRSAREIVEAVDLSNTLCALAGLDPLETADGKDFSHLLYGYGTSGEIHRIGVTEFAWSKSVRKGKYRYVYYPWEMFGAEYPDGFGELYDLAADPWEMENLFFYPQYQRVVREMESELLHWLVTTTRPKTIIHPGIFPGTQGITRFGHTVNADGKINPNILLDNVDATVLSMYL